MSDYLGPTPLTDAKIAAGARPGESWEEARARLSTPVSALTAHEWQRFVRLVDDIQRICIERLHETEGMDAGRLLIQVQNLFEYCCALSEGRPVEVVPLDQLRYGLFDEVYAMLSRLGHDETEWLPESFIGLIDVLSHPDPYSNLLFLEAEGLLKMALNG